MKPSQTKSLPKRIFDEYKRTRARLREGALSTPKRVGTWASQASSGFRLSQPKLLTANR